MTTAELTARAPRYVTAPRGRYYHYVLRKDGDRYLTACDILLVRWVVLHKIPRGLPVCPRCQAREGEIEHSRTKD